MISVHQIFKNTLEDVTNLRNTILLPIVVQVYEGMKLKKKKLCITTNKKVA